MSETSPLSSNKHAAKMINNSPRVAGILAAALGDYGNVTPASLSASLMSHAAAVVTGVPAGTVKLLAQRW